MDTQQTLSDPQQLRLPSSNEVTPSRSNRSNRSWCLVFIGMSIGIFCLCSILGSGWLLLIQRGIAEVNEMGPWPDPEVEPAELLQVDLSHLGLKAGKIQNAQDQAAWADGHYELGSVIAYEALDKETVFVWALRYDSVETAAGDFSIIQSMAQQRCQSNFWTEFLGVGVIHCRYSDAYNKLFWNNYWIVDVVALDGTDLTPDVLVDQVRDALAAHWKTVAESSD